MSCTLPDPNITELPLAEGNASELAPSSPPIQQASSRARPRIWTAILLGFGAPIVGMVLSGITSAIALISSIGFDSAQDPQDIIDEFYEFASTPAGMAVVVLPMQAVMLLWALGAAALSPQPWRDRLRLRRPGFAWWTYPILLVGMLAMGVIGGLLAALLPWYSESVDMFYDTMANASGSTLMLLLVMISVTPGIAEELLFRGYVQSRLLRRWPAILAIGLSSFAFALAHFDPIQSVAVWPVGIWLGIIAWRADSIWPSMLCHMAFNAIVVMTAGVWDEGDAGYSIEAPLWWFAFLALGLFGSVFVLARQKPGALTADGPIDKPASAAQATAAELSGAESRMRLRPMTIALILLLLLVLVVTIVMMRDMADYSSRLDEFQHEISQPIPKPTTAPGQD